MQKTNANHQKKCLQQLNDFFTPKELVSLPETLLETFLNSHYANCQKTRNNMYFFIKQIQKLVS